MRRGPNKQTTAGDRRLWVKVRKCGTVVDKDEPVRKSPHSEAGGEDSLLRRLSVGARGRNCRRGFSVGPHACPEWNQKPLNPAVEWLLSSWVSLQTW